MFVSQFRSFARTGHTNIGKNLEFSDSGETRSHEKVRGAAESKMGKGHDVFVSITTNGTNARESFLKRIRHFNTNLRFSIDGYGDNYEYIRTYGNWVKLNRNI